mmetsp:Transcript_90684/g.210959  ORF Transcript_90684/g.210959 Transcript_90684/m.210959 type:complete len:101 (-) Transcript_90684:4-306(-)
MTCQSKAAPLVPAPSALSQNLDSYRAASRSCAKPRCVLKGISPYRPESVLGSSSNCYRLQVRQPTTSADITTAGAEATKRWHVQCDQATRPDDDLGWDSC